MRRNDQSNLGSIRPQQKPQTAGKASYNMLLTALRALGERANAELKQRWKCLRRIRLCPSRIGDIVAAGIVLSTLQRGNY